MLFSDLREITGKDIPITRTYFTALVLAVMMSFMLLPTYADNTSCERDAGEHIFTDEELAWEITPENAKFFTEEFVEVKKVENEIRASSGGAKAAAADTQTEYYIIETADGYMLTSPSGGSFSRTRYSTGNSNSHLNQKWIFDKGSDGYYTVYSKTDSSKCLTVNPSTKAVTLSAYTGSQYQKWKMYISSSGNALASAATDTAVKDYKLKISSTSCSVSNTSYTAVGFFTVSSYVPATALSHADFYLTPGQAKYVYPTKTPSNASGSSNNWLIWSVSPVNSMPAVVSSDGKVTAGTTPMTFSLSFTNKITRVSGSCFITITEIANGTYFLKNKQNSNYAKVKSGTMTNGQNVVQYDFDGDAPERWIFTLNTATGYYSIKSANSGSTSYYMAVSNDATTVGTPIVIRSATESTLTDGMKWKVAKTTSGAYKLCPKTGEANGYVLNTSTAAGTNNANLTQDTYVQNTSYRDEWLFSKPESSEYSIFTGEKVPSTTISIQCIGPMTTGSAWYPLIQQSAAAWNNSVNANISITTSESSYQCVVGTFSGATWYGRTSYPVGSSNITTALIEINATLCGSDSGSRKSTITHEIGHLLGLDDNPPVSANTSLMNHNRNRDTVYVPQAYDIMNVKYIYGKS